MLKLYNPCNGRRLAIRTEPSVDAAQTLNLLIPGEKFVVSEVRRSVDGITYLKLADGRGWLFDHIPTTGKMCEPEKSKEQFIVDARHGMTRVVCFVSCLSVTGTRNNPTPSCRIYTPHIKIYIFGCLPAPAGGHGPQSSVARRAGLYAE